MKKSIVHAVAALFLLLAAAPLFAVQRNAVDEVIRMSRAGVAEETILDYVAKTDANLAVAHRRAIFATRLIRSFFASSSWSPNGLARPYFACAASTSSSFHLPSSCSRTFGRRPRKEPRFMKRNASAACGSSPSTRT